MTSTPAPRTSRGTFQLSTATLLALLITLGSTDVVRSAAYGYDVPTVALVDAHLTAVVGGDCREICVTGRDLRVRD